MADDTRTSDSEPAARAAAATPAPAALEVGGEVAGFHIEAEVGSGGFGVVYRATTPAGEVVALKVLHPYLSRDERTATRFLLEAEAVDRVHHPAVVRVRTIGGLDDGRLYIAMDWVDGHTLKKQLEAGPLSVTEARAVFEPLCEALAAVHAAGVVHRDIKASNVMLTPDGERLRVTLLDFGIAKLFETTTGAPMSFTSTGDTVGTPHTMAPEQFRGGAVDARTDVYALGVLLFEMLTGSLPFAGETAADMRRLHMDAPPPRASAHAAVPDAVDAVIARCMAKRPDQRFPSAHAVREAFAACEGAPAPADPREVDALGVFVSVAPIDDSDDALDRADDALESAATTLTELGLEVASELPSGFLALTEAPTEPETGRVLRATLVERLRELADRRDAHVRIVLHRSRARADRDGWSGPLLELRGWASELSDGVTITQAAAAEPGDPTD